MEYSPCHLFVILFTVISSISLSSCVLGDLNNTTMNSLFILKPDLSISDIRLPESVCTGDLIEGTLLVTNTGPVPASGVEVEFILMSTGSDKHIPAWLGVKRTDSFPANLRQHMPFSFSVPGGLLEGEYLMEVSVHEKETDLDMNDNTLISGDPIRVSQGKLWEGEYPDLTITIPTVTTGAWTTPGGPLIFPYMIVNKNNQSAGTFYTAFFLSPDPELSSDDYRIREEPEYSVRGNMAISGKSSDLIPESVLPGTYYLMAVVDYTAMIPETRETNNYYVYPGKIDIVSPYDLSSPDYAKKISGYIFLKTNKYREFLGLPALKYDFILSKIASDHCQDMIQRKYFSHYTPEGVDPAERAAIAGYNTSRILDNGTVRTGIAENIIRVGAGHTFGKAYIGFIDPTTPEDVADAMMIEWINSPEHNKNLINPTIDKIGTAVQFDGEYFFATQDFY